MLQARFGMALRVATLTAVAALGSLGTAQAAVYVGKWDPAYGAPYNGSPALGFTGQAKFYVPDGCLAGSNGYSHLAPTFIGVDAGCSTSDANGRINLLSAEVNLFAFIGAFNPLAVPDETLTYASPVGLYASDLGSDPVYGIVVDYNAVTGKFDVIGANVALLGPKFPGALAITPITSGAGFYLQIGLGLNGGDVDNSAGGAEPFPFVFADELMEVEELTAARAAPFLESTLVNTSCSDSGCVPNPLGGRSGPATVTFTQVPEPGSLALVLGAIAAGWAARRPRRPAAPTTR